MDFDFAKDNFHKAAQLGLGAQFLWAGAKKRIPSSELILKEFLPIAEDGLKKAGCNADDITKYLGIVHERVEAGSTGSQWQLDSFEKLKKMGTKDEALVGTTAGMFLRQQVGEPVHTWSLAEMHEAGNWVNRYWTIEQIMSTDLFTAREDDPVDYIANIMYWRNIRHLPVENDRGELSGLVTCKQLMSYYSQTAHHPVTALTRDVMISNLLTVTPEMLTIDAILLMQKNEVGCLPVVRDGKLIGLVTEYDFVSIASNLLQEWANRERQPHRPDETEG
jgi:CBS domain-containing protein